MFSKESAQVAAIAEKPLKNSYSRQSPCTGRPLQVWLVCPEKRCPVVFTDINYAMCQLAGTRQHEWTHDASE